MKFDPRGVVIVAALAGLSGCGPRPPKLPPSSTSAAAASNAAQSRVEAQALRAAMMRAQIEIAQRLVAERAGAAAAGHILRVTSEIYLPAKADYASQNLSLDEASFLQAAEAASADATASQMRWHTDGLLRQIERLQPHDRQWSKAATAKALLTELSHQYAEAVQGGFVVNEARYQDAFGLAIVAQKIVKDAVDDGVAKDPSRTPELERETEGLVNMFPSASAPKSPADAGEMLAQISRVELAFPGME